MFLHLGADIIVPMHSVISIIDMKYSKNKVNQEFISLMSSEKKIYDISSGDPKSFIITDKKVYLSPISSITLKKRAKPEYLNNLDLDEAQSE